MKPVTLKLISHTLCPYVQRARIVLAEKGLAHEIEYIDLANKPQWFTDLSPMGKVPVLLVDSQPVFESAVIVEYLNDVSVGSLHPENPLAKAQNRSWIEFASNLLATIASLYNATDKTTFAGSLELIKQRLQTLEAQVGDGPWFNGESFSLVDAAFGPVFRYFDCLDRILDDDVFADTPRVAAWRGRLRLRPSVKSAVGKTYLQLLERFLLGRQSFLSEMIAARAPA